MAKNNKNSAKSLILVIVTGVVLVAATLCWFSTAGNSKIEEVESPILGASSTAVFYYAEDKNHDGQITASEGEEYLPIESNDITLANMVPGATYFYMVQFDKCQVNSSFVLTFENVVDKNGEDGLQKYGDFVDISAHVSSVDASGTETNLGGSLINSTNPALSALYRETTNESGESQINCDVIKTSKQQTSGMYRMYYSFTLKTATEIAQSQFSLLISNVYAAVVN